MAIYSSKLSDIPFSWGELLTRTFNALMTAARLDLRVGGSNADSGRHAEVRPPGQALRQAA